MSLDDLNRRLRSEARMERLAILTLHFEAAALLAALLFVWARHVGPWTAFAVIFVFGLHARHVVRSIVDVAFDCFWSRWGNP